MCASHWRVSILSHDSPWYTCTHDSWYNSLIISSLNRTNELILQQCCWQFSRRNTNTNRRRSVSKFILDTHTLQTTIPYVHIMYVYMSSRFKVNCIMTINTVFARAVALRTSGGQCIWFRMRPVWKRYVPKDAVIRRIIPWSFQWRKRHS